MELFEKRIKFTKRVKLIPFSDLHLGARAAAENKFDKLVKWILSKEDCYAIGLGDYADLITRQDMKRFTGTTNKRDFNDELDSLLNDTRDLVIKKLKPLADAGRLLCLGEGNHEKSIKKYYSYDIMKDICKELNVTHAGYSFFMRLVLQKCKTKVRNVIIFGHHGFGGGRRSGGALNRREDLIRDKEADIYLMGHDHQKFGKRFVRLGIPQSGECRLKHKPVIVAATGSFLKTMIQGDTTYAEQFGYPANDLGVVRVDISFEGHHSEVDMHVSE